MPKRRATKQSQSKKPAGGRKKVVVRKTASHRKGQGKVSKTLAATKRNAAAKKAAVVKALSDLQRTAAQKWAWAPVEKSIGSVRAEAERCGHSGFN